MSLRVAEKIASIVAQARSEIISSISKTSTISMLVIAAITHAAEALATDATQPQKSICKDSEPRTKSTQKLGDLVGLYREILTIAPQARDYFDGKSKVTNYLAIVLNEDGSLRLRVKTVERSGHDCEIDTAVQACGDQLILIPNQEEATILGDRRLDAPKLTISPSLIQFTADSTGSFHFGPPFCGYLGYLNHKFLRTSRQLEVPESVFN